LDLFHDPLTHLFTPKARSKSKSKTEQNQDQEQKQDQALFKKDFISLRFFMLVLLRTTTTTATYLRS
jgi:hypothetical protein